MSEEAKKGVHYYSMGIVAEHKAYGSNTIEVIPVDVQPHQSGLVTGEVNTLQTTTTDATGGRTDSKTTVSKAIKADWYGDEGNRVTAPDVRRGDEVRLYRKYDSNEFLWRAKSTSDKKNNRRLEKGRWVFSATPDEKVETVDESNGYVLDVDCVNGIMSVTTSKVNGEKSAFTFQLNGKDGVAVLTNDNGEFVQLEIGKITGQNSAGSVVELDGNDIKAECNGTFTVKAKELKVTANTVTYNAKAGYTINSSKIKLGNAGTISGDNLDYTGPVKFSGSTTLNGSSITLSEAIAQQIASRIRPYL